MATREEQKKMREEYLERKNKLIKKIPSLLHELATAGEKGDELADVISHDHISILLDILWNGGKAVNITPERLRGKIQVFAHHKALNVYSFYTRSCDQDERSEGAYDHDVFWLDFDQYISQKNAGISSTYGWRTTAYGLRANVWSYAFPPIIFGPGENLFIYRASESEWAVYSEGLGIDTLLHFESIREAFVFLEKHLDGAIRDNTLSRLNTYDLTRDKPFDADPKDNPWSNFPNGYSVDYVNIKYSVTLTFYFLFGSIWMTCEPTKD